MLPALGAAAGGRGMVGGAAGSCGAAADGPAAAEVPAAAAGICWRRRLPGCELTSSSSAGAAAGSTRLLSWERSKLSTSLRSPLQEEGRHSHAMRHGS